MAFIENAVTKNIMDRRSIRAYKPDQVGADELETILTCAFNSPSGSNGQQWFISVIQDKALMEKITCAHKAFMENVPDFPEEARARMRKSTSSFFHAPTTLFVSHPADQGSGNAFILSQTVCLAAQSLGLGTCYLGGIMMFLNSEEGRAFYPELKVPEGYQLDFGITLGYPDEAPAAKARDLEKFVIVK